MGRYIVKLVNCYFEYSTIVDAPVTFGMSHKEFIDHYRAEYGNDGMRDLNNRLTSVERYGSSHIEGRSAEDILFLNRAGPNDDELTVDEIHKAYCLLEPIRDGWLVPTGPPDEVRSE